MSKIAVVVPTIRKESYETFLKAWKPLLDKHQAELFTVWDGDTPTLYGPKDAPLRASDFMGEYQDLIYNKTDACRNLGFAAIARYHPEAEYVITLDDDVLPLPGSDPIQEHLDILAKRVPLSWMSSVLPPAPYMRGFPYEIRDEAPVKVSHGVWTHVPDLDAVTQLAMPELVGGFDGPFYVGPVPKGVYFPFCGMNVGFHRDALPFMYYAPMGPKAHGLGRWADIFLGVSLKRELDANGWALYSGASTVRHDRASNVWKNLEQEATVLPLNEGFWRGEESHEYFALYRDARERWKEFVALPPAHHNPV